MKYDIAVIGCGITGAALAYELSKYSLKTVVLEAQNDVCTGTTKANSGILHAGYDPKPGTLMAELNVKGNAAAHTLCHTLDVPVKWTGSLVCAFDDEDCKTVHELYDRGMQNKVPGLEILDAQQVKELEPNLNPDIQCALYAPTAGVVSPWELGFALIETAVKNGTELKLNFTVSGISKEKDGYTITDQNGNTIQASYVLNAAGVYADKIHGLVQEPDFKILPSRGEYYLLDKEAGSTVNHIIFQCPSPTGKGVLVAPTVHGNLIAGPNAVSCQCEDTSCTSQGLEQVARLAKKSVPTINLSSNIRNFAGVRANSTVNDFIIKEVSSAPGFIDFAGMKSPGLSAACAVGEYAVQLLKNTGLQLILKDRFINTRKRIRFNELTVQEKTELVKQSPEYGRIICRCETITEGEILDAFKSPIPPVSIDSVKRRCNAGMGRCQGGFCSPRIMEILVKNGIPFDRLLQDKEGSFIVTGKL